MADLSHGLVEEDLTSSEGPSHVYMSASLKPSMVNAIHSTRCMKQISCACPAPHKLLLDLIHLLAVVLGPTMTIGPVV